MEAASSLQRFKQHASVPYACYHPERHSFTTRSVLRTASYNTLRASSTLYMSSLHFAALSVVRSCVFVCGCCNWSFTLFFFNVHWKEKEKQVNVPRTRHSSLIWGGPFTQRQMFLKRHIFEMLLIHYKQLYKKETKAKQLTSYIDTLEAMSDFIRIIYVASLNPWMLKT